MMLLSHENVSHIRIDASIKILSAIKIEMQTFT
jgi:hypothetical protein